MLREFLTSIPGVEIVAECANGFEAVKTVADLRPDVLLLDVQMPKLNGFEVIELVGRDVAVVFTTAHDEYALRAFEVHAVDYLLKPFNAERLADAIDRVRERLARRESVARRGACGGGTSARHARGARGGPRRRARARDTHRYDRLRAGPGRLCRLSRRRQSST